jgi:hypothetical protein
MSGSGGSSGVRLIDQQRRVSVIVLASDDTEPNLEHALPVLVRGLSALIVVDCVEIPMLNDADYEAIVSAKRELIDARRRLLVVNASPEDVERLTKRGVEVSATTDSSFPDDVDEWLEGLDAEE